MGLLDSMFGSGQQADGPQSPGVMTRLQAQYAPGAYAAGQEAKQQQAVYQAALQTKGISPQIAQALAMSPQYFQAQQGAFLPQATGIHTIQNTDGSQTLLQSPNPGGGAGHGLTVSGLPITEPPGTTPSPGQAAGGTPPAGSPSSAPGKAAGSVPTEGATPVASGPRTTLEGMPGSTQAIMDRVKANQAAGGDPLAGIPEQYKLMAQAVVDGKQTLKDVFESRGKGMRTVVNELALAIDPSFSESQSEARNTYRKDYYNTSIGKEGGQVKSFGTVLGHLNSQLDRAIALDNNDTEINGAPIGGTPGAHISNWIHNTAGDRAKKVNEFNTGRDTLAGETVRFLTGAEGSQKDRVQYTNMWGSGSSTPREMAGTAQAYLQMVQDKARAMENKRNANFPNPEIAKQMPILTPEHEKAMGEIQKKLDLLNNKYKGTQGGGGGLPKGWEYVK